MSIGIALATDQSQQHKAHYPDSGVATDQGASAMPGGGMPMHEQMQKMQAQMAEIHRTEDPDKRDALIQSHMADMQNMIKVMIQNMHGGKSMMGPGGIMGPGMGMQGGKDVGVRKGTRWLLPRAA
jgi:hypothetical protein